MANDKITVTDLTPDRRPKDEYPSFEQMIKDQFAAAAKHEKAFFTTDATGLYDIFLANLPEETRQFYNCKACRQFTDNFGGLVAIESSTGKTASVMWGGYEAPELFKSAVQAMKTATEKARVTGVFASNESVLGKPVTGIWTHMSVELPADRVLKKFNPASEWVAERVQEFEMLNTALVSYPPSVVDSALNLLMSEQVPRSERFLSMAKWFKGLVDKRNLTMNNRHRENLVWYSVATAGAGFCHIRNTVLGTLLDDMKAGVSLNETIHRFAKKVDPHFYQRPQAAPSEGNIREAEKLIAERGLAKSLERRYARLDDLQLIWQPKPEKEEETPAGVFGHLLTKTAPVKPAMEVPTVVMTWRKFYETVLPNAEKIEYQVTFHLQSFVAMVTAAHPEAPPIIQWDTEENRNPVSWYGYVNGSYPAQWGLAPGLVEVTGICFQPSMWNQPMDHQGVGAIFILKGAKDSNTNVGSALFPEILKSDLHGIRSVLEFHSNATPMQGADEESACGIAFPGSFPLLRVTTSIGVTDYKLDRWD